MEAQEQAESGRRTVIRASERSRSIEYAIRDLIAHARKVGREVIYLNIGDPVKFGFDTPKHVKEELLKAVKSGSNFYTESEGLPELREAIAEREKRVNGISLGKDDVIVTEGVSEGISMLMGALVEEGDEILVPGPSYPPYISYVKFFGGRPIEYRTVEDHGWAPDIGDLKSKISDKTKAVVVINPNNPTGSVYDSSALEEICSVASENNLPIVSDEIYDEIIYDARFRSVASIAKDVPVIGLNGFSKSSLMTGWRLGYLYFKGEDSSFSELKEAIAKQTRIRLCANTPAQKAAVAALQGPRDHVKDMTRELRKRRDYSLKRILEMESLSSSKPEGAFYLFPKINDVPRIWANDIQFILGLLRKTAVLLVPGSGFGKEYGSGHFRLVFLPSLDTLEMALDRLESFMSEHIR